MGKIRLGLLTILFGTGMVIFGALSALLLLTWPEQASMGRRGGAGQAGGASEDARFVSGEEFGRWRVFDGGAEPTSDEHAQKVRELEKIGYLGGNVEADPDSGITVFDRSRSFSGLNFYTSGHGPEAILMDMEGRELHRWRAKYEEAVEGDPEAETEAIRLSRPDEDREFWRRAALFPNGEVLAIFEGSVLLKVDRDSEILWARVNRAHHDFSVLEDGTIYVLTRKVSIDPDINPNEPVLQDFVTQISPEGKEIRSISLWKAFQNSRHSAHLLDSKRTGDVFHTNTLEVLDGSQEHLSSHFRKGNMLLSIRVLNLIAILDPKAEEIVWTMKGMWRQQHEPTLLDNGNILIFDNLSVFEKDMRYSRVIEFNPLTQEIVWSYAGSPDQPFYSRFCGANQRLPNGNTLITETDNGRVFEVTPNKTIVWEFINPARAGESDELIASVFELIRYESDYATFLSADDPSGNDLPNEG